MQIKLWQKIALCAMLIAFIVVGINIARAKVDRLKEAFSGKIDSIRYDVREAVFVTIKGRAYYLGPIRRRFEGEVNVNDSLVKRKNDPNYYITTAAGEVLKF